MPAEISHISCCSSPANENSSSEICAREVDASLSESVCCLLEQLACVFKGNNYWQWHIPLMLILHLSV